MPNHVSNHITFDGNKEEVNQLLSKIKGNDEFIDFNKIIPRDKFLEDNYNEPRKDDPDFDYKVKRLKDEYGTTSGYDWTTANWGTKWNAYHIEYEGSNSISFDTAWSHSFPIIEKLSEMFPKVIINVLYADESLGSNAGKYKMLNGDMDWISDETEEGCYDVYFEINGDGGLQPWSEVIDHLYHYQDDEVLRLYKNGDSFVHYIINKINLLEEYHNITEFADKNFPTTYEVDLIEMLEPIYKYMLLVRNLKVFVKQ